MEEVVEKSQLFDEQKLSSPYNIFYLPSTCKCANIEIANGNLRLKTS